MPTYEYACTACGERLEAVQSFTDASLTTCPACSGALRKIFSPVGVVFKGSGFYKTDSRRSAKVGAASGNGAAAKSEGGADGGGKDGSSKDGSDKESTPVPASTSAEGGGSDSSGTTSSAASPATGGGSESTGAGSQGSGPKGSGSGKDAVHKVA